LAVTAEKLKATKTLNDVLDWMDERFDGNLHETAKAAAEMVVAEGYISGPLWYELGVGTLHRIYKMQRITAPRQRLFTVGGQKDDEGDTQKDAEIINNAKLSYVPGLKQYFNIFDLYKEDIEQIAAHYASLEDSNGFERRYYEAVGRKLKDKQQVKDAFTYDSLMELRSEIAKD
jgi:hypothetical protein